MSSKKSFVPKLGSVDPSSFANADKCRVEEINIFWDICFERHVLKGKVHLKCKKIASSAKAPCDCNDDRDYLILDTRDITIHNITNLSNGEQLNYELGEPYHSFGSYLKINVPNVTGDQEDLFTISIEYETSDKASALQWLGPEQTLGKKEPFMFSQCQSIHCRSIIPCQDTPYVKCPYNAEITAPKQLMVLMSAIKIGDAVPVEGNRQLWKFSQTIPIPSYLLAVVAGRLKGKLLGLKSMVYAEPEIVEDCVFEFSETDKMLKTATAICGDYVWGRYDLLVLPPSFPYGGMENPCLTFVTPTLLAGDKSLANVIAHEISHSWTGNLVTNKTFEHFWLNEGFTTFIERKIQGRMFGEAHRHFHAILGLSALRDTIKRYGENSPYTSLVLKLENIDPDDAYSSVPYEKGHTFLFYLEQVINDPNHFQQFIKSYLQKFKFQSITTTDFKNYVYEFFSEKKDSLDEIDWNTWFYLPGMPPVIPDYDKTLIKDVENLAKKWIDWNPTDNCLFDTSPFSVADIESFSSSQKCLLLTNLFEHNSPIDLRKLKLMEQVYKLQDVKNAEIKCIWLRLCIKGCWKEKIPEALKFVNEQGRMKFVRPIYRDLYAWDEARPATGMNFLNNKQFMMHVCATQVEKDLGLNLV